MIDIKFKLWFTLKFEVEDFTGNVFDLCELVPTSVCIHNLEKTRLIVKQQPNMLTHLIEVNASGSDVDKPLYAPQDTLAFRYQLMDKGSAFTGKTNITTFDPRNYVVYLTNNANNKSGSTLFTNRTGTSAANIDRVFKATFGEVEKGALAVIDVFQTDLVPADYHLQDGTGKCREPVYTVRFAKHP